MTTTTAPTARPPATPVPLDLDARLATVGADMTGRLETALIRLAVDSAHVEQPGRLVDVTTVTAVEVDPVAALLLRAQRRVLHPGGWTRGAGVRGGADCLETAIQAEAHTAAEERDARIFLRRAIGSSDPIPHINRHLAGATHAGRLLGAAAALAAIGRV